MLSLENLALERGGRALFANLSLCLPAASGLLLLGKNGAGKSSLLHLIAGLLRPSAGRVALSGQNIANIAELWRAHMLYIGHQQALKPTLTVEENLRFWAQVAGEPMLLPTAFTYFELNPWRDVRVAELSAGWQRRVALARLIVQPRLVWLLDEPTTHLDQAAQVRLFDLVNTRIQQGGIVVIAAHDQAFPNPAHQLHIADFAPPTALQQAA